VAHFINGFVAEYDLLETGEKPFHDARICRLNMGLGFMPLPEVEGPRATPEFNQEFWEKLSRELASWALRQSVHFPLAYIWTEYFGGSGDQGAIVWRNGAVEFGPTATGDDSGYPKSEHDFAINRALQALGADRGKELDEFKAVDLDQYRSNDDWLRAFSKPL
jgi:hypothetical protein